MKIKKLYSLQIRNTVVIILSMALSVGMYCLISDWGDEYLYNDYMSEEKCDHRENQFIDQFKDYVTSENISIKDSDRIEKWCDEQKYIFIQVYTNTDLILETDGSYKTEYTNSGITTEDVLPEDLHEVKFADGKYYVMLLEFTENKYYNLITVISICIAFFIALAITIFFNQRVLKRILKLSQDVNEGKNDFHDMEIFCKGRDEIAQLGENINQMRKALIVHYEGEQIAWKANRDLLTAISHDIRTPLTSLMVYSELLASDKPKEDKDIKKYANVCHDKAVQLKELTDTLFQYFYAFNDNDIEMELKTYSSNVIVEQLIGEQLILLQQKGFIIDMKSTELKGNLYIDPKLLKRVFDNLFNNIDKYADPLSPIKVELNEEDNCLELVMENKVLTQIDKVASTRIGLKTCQAIMKKIGGTYQGQISEETFTSRLQLPLMSDDNIEINYN